MVIFLSKFSVSVPCLIHGVLEGPLSLRYGVFKKKSSGHTGRGQFSEHPCDQTSGHTGLGLTANTVSPMAGYGRGHSIFLKMAMGAEF